MKQINIKEYFNQEMERMRETEVDAPSLMIIDATGGDPANQIYIRNKVKDFESLGWVAEVYKANTSRFLHYLLTVARTISYDSVIVQMPVMEGIDFDYKSIPEYMDCDGLNPYSKVTPATVRGILDYLDVCEFEYEGKNAVVLGRSDIVGKPMAKALLDRNMTVSVCHSKTSDEDRQHLLKKADLVICAVGKPGLVTREECPNAFVVDVGINRVVLPDGNTKLVGDFVESQEMSEANLSTPVPGGVGLLTRLGLLKNCLELKKA